jgi:hypothetical protein
MMRSSFDEEDEFAINPFRTGGGGASSSATNQQPDDPFYSHPQQTSAPQGPPQWSLQPPAPPHQQQQQQQQQQPLPLQAPQWSAPATPLQPDPNSGMTGSFSPGVVPPAQPPGTMRSQQQQHLSGTMNRRHDPDEIHGTNPSWLHRCTSCFRIEGYQPYFDLDTSDFMQRFQASVTVWWQHDAFRTAFLNEDKPDLYGPLWIVATLVFWLAATSNLAAWATYASSSSSPSSTPNSSSISDADDSSGPTAVAPAVEAFEYDILRLIHSSSLLWTFFWAYPTFNWFVCTCLGMSQISWAMWICLYGYSSSIFLLAFPLCVLPFQLARYLALGMATFVSCLHVLRNLSGPLLSQDAANQAKASPVILSMMGAHFVLFLILKYRFFK